MDEYEDLDTYNGDTEYDIWNDFDNCENTGTPGFFNDTDPDELINNLYDWDWLDPIRKVLH